MSFITRFLITLSPVLFGVVNAFDVAELPPPAKHEINFAKEIWPLFQKHCVKCHGPEKQKSGYRIDISELALEGGEMGVAIIPGDSAKSPLIHFISGLDEEVVMPPKGDPFTAKTNSGGNVVVRQLEPTIHYEFAFMFPADRPRTTLASMFIQAAEEGLRQQSHDHHH